MEALKRAWKSRHFQVLLDIILALASIFAIFAFMRLALGVEHPLLVVSSGSMRPTLNVGDVIVVKGVTPDQINVGDIVVFRNPWKEDELIVHRVVGIRVDGGGNYLVTTLGDNTNPAVGGDQFSPWNASRLVGRVVMRIPYLGSIYLLTYWTGGLALLIIIVVLIISVLIASYYPPKAEGRWGTRIRPVYIAAVNVLLIGLLAFSLWGHIEVQPAVDGKIEMLGMYEDLRVNEMRYGYGNASLSIGFMTYRIDCQLDNYMRQGATTFSWFQALLFITALFNIEEFFGQKIRGRIKKIFLGRRSQTAQTLRLKE